MEKDLEHYAQTLKGCAQGYKFFVENMNEGALSESEWRALVLDLADILKDAATHLNDSAKIIHFLSRLA